MSNRTSQRNVRARRERNKKIAAVATLLSLVGLIAGTLAVATSGSSTATSSTTTSTTATTIATTTTSLDPSTFTADGQALYALIQAGRASSYHVVFTATGSQLAATTTAASLELWRAGPLVRHDTVINDTSSGDDHQIEIGGPTGDVVCDQQAALAPTCKRQSTTPVAPDDDVLSIVTSVLSGAVIATVTDTIAGVDATCYRTNGFDPTSTTSVDTSSVSISGGAEVCLTTAGVPLRLATSGLTLVATAVDSTVDPAVFDPPVPVS